MSASLKIHRETNMAIHQAAGWLLIIPVWQDVRNLEKVIMQWLTIKNSFTKESVRVVSGDMVSNSIYNSLLYIIAIRAMLDDYY